jgi:hypothetical protein
VVIAPSGDIDVIEPGSYRCCPRLELFVSIKYDEHHCTMVTRTREEVKIRNCQTCCNMINSGRDEGRIYLEPMHEVFIQSQIVSVVEPTR